MDKVREGGNEENGRNLYYEYLQKLGSYYTSINDFGQAQRCYEQAASLGLDEPQSYIALGVIALQKNLLDDAEIAFRVACRLDPGCAKAQTGLAMVYQQRRDYQQAFEQYMKCLELDGDNITALLGLFQTSCQMGSFGKIIFYLQEYLKIHPGDTAVLFSLAALYIKDDQLERSRQILMDVLAIDRANQDAANLLEEVEHNLAQQNQAAAKTR